MGDSTTPACDNWHTDRRGNRANTAVIGVAVVVLFDPGGNKDHLKARLRSTSSLSLSWRSSSNFSMITPYDSPTFFFHSSSHSSQRATIGIFSERFFRQFNTVCQTVITAASGNQPDQTHCCPENTPVSQLSMAIPVHVRDGLDL